MVIEQTADQDFNRAALMNVGYEESKNYDDFDCLVFHDVDLLPEDDRNQYTCPSGKLVADSSEINSFTLM